MLIASSGASGASAKTDVLDFVFRQTTKCLLFVSNISQMSFAYRLSNDNFGSPPPASALWRLALPPQRSSTLSFRAKS